MCWQLVRPLALLASLGSWKTLGVPFRLGHRGPIRGLVCGETADGERQTESAEGVEARECGELDPDQLEFVVDQLGGPWRDRIVQSDADITMLEGCATILLATANRLRAPTPVTAEHSTQKLVKYILLAGLVRDTGKLAETVWRALDGVYPALAKSIRDRLMEPGVVPSKSSLSRYRMTLDVAFMLCRRKREMHHDMMATCIYLLADSSPQLRRDF